MNPVASYALAASRHMHEFGTTREQLAEVAVAARQWARANPGAWSRDELTIEDVLAAPMVCDPFGVRDCCLVTDGGAAVVVVDAPSALADRPAPAYLLGAGEAHSHRHISHMPDLTTTGAVQSGARAFAMAGLTPADVDVLQLYDAFTITPILFLEDLGFCAKGEGGPFVTGGRIAPGRRAARQHQRRRTELPAPGHVRPACARRGGAAAARRVDRPGRRRARRAGPRQRRRAQHPVHRAARRCKHVVAGGCRAGHVAESSSGAPHIVAGAEPATWPSEAGPAYCVPMDFALTDEQDLIRSTARQFADEVIVPGG